MIKKTHLLLLLASVSLPVIYADQVEISGDASTAPVYVLDGTGTTTMVVNGDNSEDDPENEFPGLTVSQDFTFTMDNLGSGKVPTQGVMAITGDDGGGEWDAAFNAGTDYVIKQYGDLITISFNHKLQSASGSQTIVGEEVDEATITSRGKATLVPEDGSFSGTMSGRIVAAGLDPWDYNVPFTQEFSDIQADDLGDWTAVVNYEVIGKKVIPAEEPSTLSVGPSEDPVDTVDLAVKGSFNPKTEVLVLATKGEDPEDKKVVLKVTAKEDESPEGLGLVEDKSQISAAAQKRKF